MLKRFSPLIILGLTMLVVLFNFYSSKPKNVSNPDVSKTEFSTLRAFEHVKEISRAPHFVGSSEHGKVKTYLVNQLQNMGLEVQTQEGYSLHKSGAISFARNIMARIPGSEGASSKCLLLMSHYDSAVHSSPGASDAASGVATILEGIRAFLQKNEPHKNDIIILFTDAEEIGLLGAKLFVEKHPWVKNVGLALNFESRGSGGNSYMLLETNEGNASLIKEFKKADPDFPVTNSLAYSIYKMLPNDTDLTVLREQEDINGFNFAFIDDHFDYHTANDSPANLDKETLAHQGSYLIPLLNHFKDTDLALIKGNEDLIYFSMPGGKMISYPFSWSIPLLIIGFILFLAVVIFGIFKNHLNFKTVIRGAIPFLLSLVVSGTLVFLLWQLCLMIYPEYGEMEHGFTYNGYWYIAAAIFLSLTINLMIYHHFGDKEKQAGYFVFPLLFWLLICTLTALYLEGAAYFIIPAFFGILQLFYITIKKEPNLYLLWVLNLPALIIVLPFIPNFPVALGLKILFVAALLTTLLFSLYLPVFGYFKEKKALGLLCFLVFNILFITAHFKSSFSEERQKPNSLVYILDADTNNATWNSYDNLIDPWTETYFGKNPQIISDPDNDFSSKYSSGFTYKNDAPVVEVPLPGIIFQKLEKEDSIKGKQRYSLKIAPNRKINRIEVFADRDANFEEFTVNFLKADSIDLGVQAFHVFSKRWSNRLLTYYAVNTDTLRLEFVIDPEKLPEFTIYEASNDLLQNAELKVKARGKTMIPRPFVLNDAVIVKKTIRFE